MPPIKPGRWSANPADVDSRFSGLWRGLRVALPMWGGDDGSTSDIAQHVNHPVVGATVIPTPSGPGLDFAGAGYLNVGSHDFASDGFTFAAYVKWGSDTVDAGLFGIHDSLQLWRDEFSPDRIQIAINDGGWFVADGGEGLLDTTAYHLYVWTFEPNGDLHNIYYDNTLIIADWVRNVPSFSEVFRFAANDKQTIRQLDGTIAVAYIWDRPLSVTDVSLLVQDPFGLIRPALLETVTVVDDRSGSGSIVEGHTVVGEGRKNATDTGAISHGHTVIGQGDKAASDTAAISHGHTIVSEGAKAGLGTGTISHGHTIVSEGLKAGLGIGDISPGHTVVAAGTKSVSSTGSISHGHTVVATGHVGVAVTETRDPRRIYNEVLERDFVDTARDYDAITRDYA